MGICGSKQMSPEEKRRLEEEAARNRALDKQIQNDFQKDSNIHKLLLLGAGESGKSTLFKQMITLYGKGFPDEERKNYKSIIYNNVITSMKTLCHQVSSYGKILPENEDAFHFILSDMKEEIIDERVANMISNLWNDPAIKLTYDNRADFQLTDSAEYFFDKVQQIGQKSYLPTEQDVLRSRVRTTGIVDMSFTIDQNHFKMYDVGGQRNERKKWIHCFENVTAVIFVAAISEYDQKLYEDENTNRLTEAFNLFDDICNSRWFKDTAMILFLNKRDIFNTKIQKIKLSDYFPIFPGPDYDAIVAQEWIRDQFISRNRVASKTVYSHVTCATDRDNVSTVFNDVKKIVINTSLQNAGLIS